jgi:hypothetical protein
MEHIQFRVYFFTLFWLEFRSYRLPHFWHNSPLHWSVLTGSMQQKHRLYMLRTCHSEIYCEDLWLLKAERWYSFPRSVFFFIVLSRARYLLVVIMPRFARIALPQAPQGTWHHGIYLHILQVTFYVLELLHDLSYAWFWKAL